MSISYTTISEVKRTVYRIAYLLTLPSINLGDLGAEDKTCPICYQTFNKTPYQINRPSSFNQPVKLTCGHHFDIRCIAHLVIDAKHNAPISCPLCRAGINLKTLAKQELESAWNLFSSVFHLVANLDGSSVVDRNISFDARVTLREAIVSHRSLDEHGTHMGRTIVLWDELTHQFCVFPAPGEDRPVDQASMRGVATEHTIIPQPATAAANTSTEHATTAQQATASATTAELKRTPSALHRGLRREGGRPLRNSVRHYTEIARREAEQAGQNRVEYLTRELNNSLEELTRITRHRQRIMRELNEAKHRINRLKILAVLFFIVSVLMMLALCGLFCGHSTEALTDLFIMFLPQLLAFGILMVVSGLTLGLWWHVVCWVIGQ